MYTAQRHEHCTEVTKAASDPTEVPSLMLLITLG